jgi:phospholipid/cholesterol/gamma-HCH transport system substrate-binding protein
MITRSSGREFRVGVLVVLALAALLALFGLAGGGPGFLANRQSIDVDFRDGQGIRPGSLVRIAGIDAGRVTDVSLAEVDGLLHARVRLAVPVDLAARLRQDVKITIQANLTGQSRVNIVSAGRSPTPLASGTVVQGVETTLFDPILEQVGLGPVERSHLSHTITEVRGMIDDAAPKVRDIVASVHDTASGLRETSANVRPVIENTISHVEEATRRVAAASPKIELTLTQIASLTSRVDGLLAENRPNIQATIASLRDLTATLRMAVDRDNPKVSALLDHVEFTRARADLMLDNLRKISDLSLTMLVQNKVDIERSVTNVKEMTDWGSKLVQKIYANPFVISPLYKPKPQDVRAQSLYDVMLVFSNSAQKLEDTANTLEAIQSKPSTPALKAEIEAIRAQVADVNGRISQVSQALSAAFNANDQTPRRQR